MRRCFNSVVQDEPAFGTAEDLSPNAVLVQGGLVMIDFVEILSGG